jgi:GT2 family glycosyltransferase
MTMTRTAAMLTCHNRVERTISCLESLQSQIHIAKTSVHIVLVDAGSTDGTREAVIDRFPDATVLTRGPELFWNGGMRVAFAHAFELDPDLYLWLNDDVDLDADALGILLATHETLATDRPNPCIIVGSTRDPITAVPTYGGVVRTNRWRPMRYELVRPGPQPRPAETMNGNCVLIPRDAVARIGSLSSVYTHGMGDYDYGHRAVRAGCEVWTAPGTIGTCSRNPPASRASSLEEYRRRVTSPTGGLPPGEWFTFVRRWAGPLWPVYGVSPYIRRFTRWLVHR